LFQAPRYKDILVDKDNYLLTIGKQIGFKGLGADAILLQFVNQHSQAIEGFQTFIAQGIGRVIRSDLKHQISLGDSNFVEKNAAFDWL